jgi:hypothetical protein
MGSGFGVSTRKADSRPALYEPVLGKRIAAAVADNEVVEQAHVNDS